MSSENVEYSCDNCDEVDVCQFAYDDYNKITPETDENKCLLDDTAKVMSGKF